MTILPEVQLQQRYGGADGHWATRAWPGCDMSAEGQVSEGSAPGVSVNNASHPGATVQDGSMESSGLKGAH